MTDDDLIIECYETRLQAISAAKKLEAENERLREKVAEIRIDLSENFKKSRALRKSVENLTLHALAEKFERPVSEVRKITDDAWAKKIARRGSGLE